MATQPLSSRSSARMPFGCLGVFFLLFFAAGAVMFYFVTLRTAVRFVSSRSWQETTCTVLSSQVAESSDSDGGSTYRPDIHYTYSVGGRAYQAERYDLMMGSTSGREGKEAIVARYPEGARVPCWYDPADPQQAVLSREPTLAWLLMLLPLPFLLVGGVGLVWTARSAVSSRTSRNQRSGLPLAPAAPFGVEPPAAALTGPLELRPAAGPWARFVTLTLVACFWNGIVSVFVYQAYKLWRAGTPNGCMTVFLIPFVAIGLMLIVGAGNQFLVLFNPRLRLTLSPGVLALGGNGYLQWGFAGRAGRVRRLTLVLEGREEATYRQGTDTKTDHQVFASLALLDSEQPMEIQSGSTSFSVPAGAVPSFTAPHNKIRWAIKAHCDIAGWPDSDDDYEVVVRPAGAV